MPKVLIVGAGLTGLAATLLPTRAGLSAVERMPETVTGLDDPAKLS